MCILAVILFSVCVSIAFWECMVGMCGWCLLVCLPQGVQGKSHWLLALAEYCLGFICVGFLAFADFCGFHCETNVEVICRDIWLYTVCCSNLADFWGPTFFWLDYFLQLLVVWKQYFVAARCFLSWIRRFMSHAQEEQGFPLSFKR